MIPAPNTATGRFGWRPNATRCLHTIALHLGAKDAPVVLSELPCVEIVRPEWLMVTAEGLQNHAVAVEAGLMPGTLLMLNMTLPSDGGLPYTVVPSVYRAARAAKHASLVEITKGQYLNRVHVALGRATRISQHLVRGDVVAEREYQNYMAHLFKAAKHVLERSKRDSDQRLLERLKRTGEVIDSKGRFNPCALPLILRLVQRLANTKETKMRLRSGRSAALSLGWAQAIAELEKVTEFCATQLMAIAESPGLQPHRWSRANRREIITFKQRLRFALNGTLPDIEDKLRMWDVPQPFCSVFADAAVRVQSGRLALEKALKRFDLQEMKRERASHISGILAGAAQTLALLLVNSVMQDVLAPIARAVRENETKLRLTGTDSHASGTEAPVLATDIEGMLFLATDALDQLGRVYVPKGAQAPRFTATLDAVQKLIKQTATHARNGDLERPYELLREAELLIPAL